MQFKNVALLSVATLVATASAEGYTPGEPWSTLTPTATYSCGISNYNSTFGIAVQTVGSQNAKREAVSQIGDGQVQATSTSGSASLTATSAAPISVSSTSTTSTKTTDAASQISDGQIQQSTVSAASSASSGSTTTLEPSSSKTQSSSSVCATAVSLGSSSCKNSGTLEITLNDGILTDGKGRVGSIVANRQFQFDGPPPQAGAIYAAGWSITPAGNLAIGGNDVFYQCLSGDFYNLYDESIGSQCTEIYLEVVSLVAC